MPAEPLAGVHVETAADDQVLGSAAKMDSHQITTTIQRCRVEHKCIRSLIPQGEPQCFPNSILMSSTRSTGREDHWQGTASASCRRECFVGGSDEVSSDGRAAFMQRGGQRRSSRPGSVPRLSLVRNGALPRMASVVLHSAGDVFCASANRMITTASDHSHNRSRPFAPGRSIVRRAAVPIQIPIRPGTAVS